MAKNKNFEKLLKAQAAIVTALADGTVSNLAGLSFEKARQAVGPIGLVKLDESFRSHLCGYSRPKPWFGFLSRPKGVDQLLADHPWLAKAAIHARDGHLRQKAVLGLLEPEKDPLDLAALLCRCNEPSARSSTCRHQTLETDLPVTKGGWVGGFIANPAGTGATLATRRRRGFASC